MALPAWVLDLDEELLRGPSRMVYKCERCEDQPATESWHMGPAKVRLCASCFEAWFTRWEKATRLDPISGKAALRLMAAHVREGVSPTQPKH